MLRLFFLCFLVNFSFFGPARLDWRIEGIGFYLFLWDFVVRHFVCGLRIKLRVSCILFVLYRVCRESKLLCFLLVLEIVFSFFLRLFLFLLEGLWCLFFSLRFLHCWNHLRFDFKFYFHEGLAALCILVLIVAKIINFHLIIISINIIAIIIFLILILIIIIIILILIIIIILILVILATLFRNLNCYYILYYN